MWGTAAVAAIAAICLSKWCWEADYETFTKEVVGNGFHQCNFGLGVLGLAPPACFRVLFPAILHPLRTESDPDVPPFGPWDWICYQSLRCLAIFLGLLLLGCSVGLVPMLLAAALFGLTIRYDYWSNTVEFLAASFVVAAGVFHWDWRLCMALGLVLGTGRETVGFLAILGTPWALAVGAGAVFGHVGVRLWARTEPHWRGTLEYANPMWRQNWDCLTGQYGPNAVAEVLIYLAVAALAFPVSPILTGSLVIVTALIARMDEPRVLTMLIPFAAMTLARLL